MSGGALPATIAAGGRPPAVFVVDVGRAMLPFAPVRRALLGAARPLLALGFGVLFVAAGDPRCHLLQVSPPATDSAGLAAALAAIHPCGLDRSFELALYVLATRCPVEPGGRGAVLVVGSGPFRDAVPAGHVRSATGDELVRHPYTHEVLAALEDRCDLSMTYVARTAWDLDACLWRQALGADRVVVARGPARLGPALRRQVARLVEREEGRAARATEGGGETA